jgi:hypothetical protein
MKDLHNDDEVMRELDEARKEREMLSFKTSLAKAQFIDEMKNGLGDEIKETGNKVEIIKPTFFQKIGKIIKKIFTGF